MSKYRKKPIVIEAVQWFKNGDHPVVESSAGMGDRICETCGHPSNAHGWCPTPEFKEIVCVGDWIITGIKGEFYPCKNEIFVATYDAVESPESPPEPGDSPVSG